MGGGQNLFRLFLVLVESTLLACSLEGMWGGWRIYVWGGV